MTFNNFNESGPVEVDMAFDFTADDSEELELTVVANFTPGRPAPSCSNPDDPAFSDSGDPAEWTVTVVRNRRTGDLVSPSVWENNEAFDEAVGEALLEDLEQHRHERAYARVGYL